MQQITTSMAGKSVEMASQTTTTGPPSKWADTEKIALLLSVIKTSGTKVKWADVSVPAGRTMQSAAKMYSEMLKASAGVAMTIGADITPSKKRARKNHDDGSTTPTEKKKRVRKPKVVARAAAASSDEDDGEKPNKKIKVESKEEDEEEDDALHGIA